VPVVPAFLMPALPARVLAVSLDPSTSALPGSNVLQTIADGIGSWAMIAAMIGVVVGGVIWAFGHYSQNYQQAYNGRKGVMVSGLAALLVGAAPTIINFFVAQGHTVR
jgi:MFS family permease